MFKNSLGGVHLLTIENVLLSLIKKEGVLKSRHIFNGDTYAI